MRLESYCVVVKESFVFLSSLTVSLEPGEINVGCMSCQLCCEAPQGSRDDGNIVRDEGEENVQGEMG